MYTSSFQRLITTQKRIRSHGVDHRKQSVLIIFTMQWCKSYLENRMFWEFAFIGEIGTVMTDTGKARWIVFRFKSALPTQVGSYWRHDSYDLLPGTMVIVTHQLREVHAHYFDCTQCIRRSDDFSFSLGLEIIALYASSNAHVWSCLCELLCVYNKLIIIQPGWQLGLNLHIVPVGFLRWRAHFHNSFKMIFSPPFCIKLCCSDTK